MYKYADFHCDTLLGLLGNSLFGKEIDIAADNPRAHQDLPRLLATNYVFQCFAAFFSPFHGQEPALRQTLFLLNAAKEKIFSQPGIEWVKSAADVKEPGAGKMLGLLSIEGADFVGSDLFLIELVHNMGVRLITLTWNGRNSIADGVKVGGAGGLTDLGVEAVKLMERLKIIIDVSHLAEAGFWDLCRAADRPFVASHSNAWAICPHPRNLKDEQIREISRRGGVIGMNLCTSFVAEDPEQRNLTTLVRHMAHIAEVGSVANLCLGADLDGISEMPHGMKDVQDMAKLPAEMAAAGFSEAEIKAICADNLLRFLKDNLE